MCIVQCVCVCSGVVKGVWVCVIVYSTVYVWVCRGVGKNVCVCACDHDLWVCVWMCVCMGVYVWM